MIKIAVCDDEIYIRTYLISLIQKQGVECEITAFADAAQYLTDKSSYDLLFLDIEFGQSPSVLNGMELAKQIREKELDQQPVLIFVTGYEAYV